MSALDYSRVLAEHSDEDLLQILRALGAAGCTGSLAVSSVDNAGVIFMEAGWVVDALVTDGSWLGEGVPAIALLANLSYPELEFSEVTDFSRRTIKLDMDRLEDMVEQVRPLLLPPEPKASPTAAPAPAGEAAHEEVRTPAATDAATERRTVHRDAGESSSARDLFGTLRSVSGYLAAAIVDDSGAVLAQDASDEDVDLATLGQVFAQIFHLTRETTADMGLGPCSELTAVTPAGTVTTRCSEHDDIRVLCVLAPEGNSALAKLRIDAALPTLGPVEH